MRRPLPADPATTVSPRGPEKPPRDTPLPLLPGSGVGVRWQAHWTCPRVQVSALSSSYRTAAAGNGLLGATPRRLLVFLGHCGGAGAAARGPAGCTGGAGRLGRPGLGPGGSAECSLPELPGAAITKGHQLGGFRQKCWLSQVVPAAETRPSRRRSPASIPGQETRAHVLQLTPGAENTNINKLINFQKSFVLPLLTRQSLQLSPQPPCGAAPRLTPTLACSSLPAHPLGAEVTRSEGVPGSHRAENSPHQFS